MMSETCPSADQLASSERLAALGAFLDEHHPLWAERAFISDEVALERDHPALAAWLLACSTEQIRDYESHPERLAADAPEPLADFYAAASALTSLPKLSQTSPPLPEPRLRWEVPGRKLEQITRFVTALEASHLAPERWGDTTLVDWCAGKGYLGRLMAARGAQVSYVEQVPERCTAGQRLDRHAAVEGQWVVADAHDPRAHALLEGNLVVALHACGELHREVVERGLERGVQGLAIAPCCYHREHRRRVPAERDPRREGWTLSVPAPPAQWTYEPLSRQAREALARQVVPHLDEHALRLATASQQVARPRVVALRDRERAYRLALDPLLRKATGVDRYLSLPPFPTAWLNLDFRGFVRALERELALDLVGHLRSDSEDRGWRRLHRVRALGLVRGLFRRPIELWLALDTALLLEEEGYELRLGTFCPEAVTPRNILLLAGR